MKIMLDDFNCLDLENFEHQLYSQVHHSTFAENNIRSLDKPSEMPPRKISYKPVRYFPRKNNTPAPRVQDQQRPKTIISSDHQNSEQTENQTPQISGNVHPYPINNILVFPQSSDTLINVIQQSRRDFSYKKLFRKLKRQKEKSNKRTWKNIQSSNLDVKPIISEIKLGNVRKITTVNRHTIILSDSEDEVSVEELKNNWRSKTNFGKDDKITVSTDDDVILVESPAVDIIEVDDCNTEQVNEKTIISNHKSNEHNELLSTPESSISNDFLEISQVNPNPNFNFSLHGSEFKDSEFLRPTVNVDISESGSISSISDISSSMKTNVFSVVEFPKEKDNLFDENNLERFKHSITPQRFTKNAIIEDNANLDTTTDERFKNNQLPTLSDICSDENSHKRVRGRSIIRELVNDRAFVLLSSAEKKMKVKKRKSKDCIGNTITEDNLTENTLSQFSKKKKKKKSRKKDVNVDEENNSNVGFTENNFCTISLDTNMDKNEKYEMSSHNSQEKFEDYDRGKHLSKIMIRTDLFSNTNVTAHVRSKKDKDIGDAEVLEISEINSRYKKKKMTSECNSYTSDVNKKSKEDRLISEHIVNENSEECEFKKKLDKNDFAVRNDEVIEFHEEINKTIEKKKKRKKDKSTSESEMIDNANAEAVNVNDRSISKNKCKRKRLSENEENENNHQTAVKACGTEVNMKKGIVVNCNITSSENAAPLLKPEKTMKQKILFNSEILNNESLPPLTNQNESTKTTCIEDALTLSENDSSFSKSKHKKKLLFETAKTEKSYQDQIIGSDMTSDKTHVSFECDDVQTHKRLLDDHEAIEKLQFVENQNGSLNNTDTEYLLSSETNNSIFKRTVENSNISATLGEIDHSNQITDDLISLHSSKSIFPEITYEPSCIEENNCINEKADKNFHSGEKLHSVWNVCPTKFFSSSESLFTVSSISSETHSKNICNMEGQGKHQNANNVAVSSISSISVASNSDLISPESISENLTTEVKPPNQIEEINPEMMQLTEQNLIRLPVSKSLTTVTGNVDSDKIPVLSTEVKIEDSSDNIVQDENTHLEVEVLDESTENLLTQNDGDFSEQFFNQVVVKTELENSGTLDDKEKQDVNFSTPLECNSSSVSSSMKSKCGLEASTSKEKLPDVIKKIVSKQNNVSSMRKLCEFLEEVNDPHDVLKKVSMIKEAFLAKSVNIEIQSVNSPTQEHVDDQDDIISISSDSSSIVCVENDCSVIDIMDDITLINCDLGRLPASGKVDNVSLVGEVQGKDIQTPQKTIVQNFSEQDTLHLNDNQDVPGTHELEQKSSVPEKKNRKRCLKKYDVEVIQQFMSDDLNLWKICSDDLPKKRYIPKGKRCIKCREFGHLGNSCPNTSNLPKCILCGAEGHLDFKCPNKICIQCGRKSSIMQSICQHCKHYRSITCSLCTMKGHPRHKCPDLWRRYHLTVEHGPLVKLDGMKLKDKDNLWCSFCAKSGHLEHYCFLAQRNRNFQQLDPTIHNYGDIYDVEVNKRNNIKNKMPPNRSAVSEISNRTPENTSVDQCNSTKNLVRREMPVRKLSKLEATTPLNISSSKSHLQAIPGIESAEEVSLENSSTTSSNVGIEGLPPDFFVLDEVCNTPSNQKSILNPDVPVTLPNEISNEIISTETAKISTTNSILDSKKVNERKELSNNSVSSTFHVNTEMDQKTISKALPKSQLVTEIDNSDSNFDILDLFMTSEINCLKNYVRDELNFLKNSSFKVKNYYYRFLAYNEDNNKPSNERRISLLKKQKLNKELNMMLFGREQLKAGGIHHEKLVIFVNTSVGIPSNCTRESLYYSYQYLFSKTEHSHVNYPFVMRLLMRKYQNKTI